MSLKRSVGKPRKEMNCEIVELRTEPKGSGRKITHKTKEELKNSYRVTSRLYYENNRYKIRVKQFLSANPNLSANDEFMEKLNAYSYEDQYNILIKRNILLCFNHSPHTNIQPQMTEPIF